MKFDGCFPDCLRDVGDHVYLRESPISKRVESLVPDLLSKDGALHGYSELVFCFLQRRLVSRIRYKVDDTGVS